MRKTKISRLKTIGCVTAVGALFAMLSGPGEGVAEPERGEVGAPWDTICQITRCVGTNAGVRVDWPQQQRQLSLNFIHGDETVVDSEVLCETPNDWWCALNDHFPGELGFALDIRSEVHRVVLVEPSMDGGSVLPEGLQLWALADIGSILNDEGWEDPALIELLGNAEDAFVIYYPEGPVDHKALVDLKNGGFDIFWLASGFAADPFVYGAKALAASGRFDSRGAPGGTVDWPDNIWFPNHRLPESR